MLPKQPSVQPKVLHNEKKQELIQIFKKDPEKLKQILQIAKEMKQSQQEEKVEVKAEKKREAKPAAPTLDEKERQLKEQNLQNKLRNLGIIKTQTKDPRLMKP